MTTRHEDDDAAKLSPASRWPRVKGVSVAWGTPRKLPKPDRLPGRVAVVDIAFASEGGGRRNSFEKTTLKFIDKLGDRLAAWVDHHDSRHHDRFAEDHRFTLSTKAEHGACPEMVTPEVVEAAGAVDCVVCHTDFDGLASAAKWIRGGVEPYEGCDDDARAVDTRIGFPGERGARIDRAIRARPKDTELYEVAVRLLAAGAGPDAPGWAAIDAAGAELIPREAEAKRLSGAYRPLSDDLVIVDATVRQAPYDRTHLLLLGQQQATMAAVIDGDNVTFAAPFDSGVDFLARFGLSGGMPTLVSIHKPKLAAALQALGVSAERAAEV